jgi:hypothetical protein
MEVVNRLRELQEKKWNMELRLRSSTNIKAREKCLRCIKDIEKNIRISRKMNKVVNRGAVK